MSPESRPTGGDDQDRDSWLEDYGPLDALRSVSDVQRRGLDAAADVVERFSTMIDGLTGRPPESAETSGDGPDPLGAQEESGEESSGNGDRVRFTRMRADAARAVDLYVDLFQKTFEAYADMVESTVSSDRPASDSGAGSAITHLVLPDASAGDRMSATVWLHNQSPTVVDATPRSTDLERHDGGAIPARCVTFEPPALPGVQPGTSRAITVSITLPDDTAPSTYHGLVLASGLEAASIPVTVTVLPDKPAAPS